MNPDASSTHASRLRSVLAHPYLGIWGAVAMPVLICAIMAWLQFQQRDTLQRTVAAMDTIGQARIDLARGFTHTMLGADPSLPFEREGGLALLHQGLASIEGTASGLGSNPESVRRFHQDAEQFRDLLVRWSESPTPLLGTDLRVEFHQLDAEAERVESDTRTWLHSLLERQRMVFVGALSAAALLLAGICAVAIVAGRGRPASLVRTRLAEQAWREADRALQRSEARLRDTFEHAAVGIAHIALSGHFLRVNQKLCDIVGYTREELQSKTFQDITHPQDVAADLALGQRAQAGEIGNYSSEKRYICKNGRVVWVSRTTTLVRSADGSPDYYLSVIEDVQIRKDMEAALRASEERLRLALRVADQGLFEFDLRTWKATLNPEHLRMLGYDAQRADADYEELRDRRHPDDRERLDRMYEEYAQGKRTSHREELRLRTRTGEWIWVLSFGQVAQWDEAGKPVRVVGTSTDITERKRAEETLRNSERRFRALIEHSSDSISVADAGNNILYLSPAVKAVEGYSPEELVGHSGIENTHPEDLPMVGRIVEHLLASPGKPVPVLWRRRHKDGHWIWLEGFATNLLDDPAVRGIVTNYHDVTERKHAEDALAAERTLLRTLIDALPDIVFTKDTKGALTLCNAASIKYLGFSREDEVIGRSVFDFYPRELAQLYDADDRQVLAGEPVLNREEPSLDWEGKRGWYLTIKVPLRSRTGEIIGLVGMSRDITERKGAEELLRRTQKMEALGTLAGGIAHDFNNILVAINGNARLAVADLPADHPVQESLIEIARAGARATELVRRILAFSRPQESRKDTLELRPVVEEALKLLRSTLPAMIDIRLSASDDVPAVNAEAGQIHQVMMNLITNAAHAIGDNVGLIEVGLDAISFDADLAQLSVDLREGRYTRLSVSDNGCGMDKLTLERIFDPFFTTKPAGQGTGLGLSVVHGIMRGHDGSVTAYSQPGKGTTFRLYFPAAERPVSIAPGAQRTPPQANGQRVLYVDDESALVQLAARSLGRLGYRVSGHDDPAQALEAFRVRPKEFDIVITDLSMPGMSGFELARAVLAMRPEIPLLLTSGYVRPQDEEIARSLGVHSVILKPGTVEELSRILDRVFQERAQLNR